MIYTSEVFGTKPDTIPIHLTMVEKKKGGGFFCGPFPPPSPPPQRIDKLFSGAGGLCEKKQKIWKKVGARSNFFPVVFVLRC